MNDHDIRDLWRSLDPNKRYLPTTREYGQIMMDNREKRKDALAAARARAKQRNK